MTFNGLPAPLLYSSNGQINAIVPWGIQGALTANVCVVYQSNATNCMAMNVTSAAPGIFQMPSGYAAAVNQDGMINSPQNPAASGSVISLYVTGLGPVSPMPADGSIVGFPLPTLANGVKVWFIPSRANTAFPGEVLYAGTAPLEVAGLYQINVLIPVIPLLPATVEVEVDLPDGSSLATAFPGHPFGPHRYKKDGHWYLGASPSKKSVARIKEKVGDLLVPGNKGTWEDDRLNQILRGWATYFSYGTRAAAYRGNGTSLRYQCSRPSSSLQK